MGFVGGADADRLFLLWVRDGDAGYGDRCLILIYPFQK